jgi:hypothetical protein
MSPLEAIEAGDGERASDAGPTGAAKWVDQGWL